LGDYDIQNMDPEEALREKRLVEQRLQMLNATINKASSSARGGKSPSVRALQQSKTVLKNLMKHRHAWVFNEPVDPVKLGIPQYFEIIKHPMDLGTVKKRLDRGYYTDVSQFAQDVRLVFNNAQQFNKPETDVHKMAGIVREVFEQKFAKINPG